MGRKDIITKEYMEDTEVLEHFTSNFREVMQFIKYSKDTEKLSQLPRLHPSFWIVYQNWNTAAMTQPVLPFGMGRTRQEL